MKYKTLSIAGFDSSGGAGIQADLKTFSALGCYGMTILTALPVQNTLGVKKCYDIPLSAIEEQLHTIFEDITPDAIKIGMLFSSEIISLVANFLKKYAQNIPLILDPVMVAKSGDNLLLPEAITTLKEQLIPISTIITPNIPEAQTLINVKNISINNINLAKSLISLGPEYVLLKGGHDNNQEKSIDILIDKNNNIEYLESRRIKSKNTHGTGCTLSAAICAYLAQEYDILTACKLAKDYIFNAIQHSSALSVGKGNGPVHHFYNIW